MSLKIKIQLWMNVQLWTYRPQFSVCVWGGGGIFLCTREVCGNLPASPESLNYPERGGKETGGAGQRSLVTHGGPSRPLCGRRMERFPLSQPVWASGEKRQKGGIAEDSKSEIKHHYHLMAQHYG